MLKCAHLISAWDFFASDSRGFDWQQVRPSSATTKSLVIFVVNILCVYWLPEIKQKVKVLHFEVVFTNIQMFEISDLI